MIQRQYDQIFRYATAIRLGTAEAEAILRRFTRTNVPPTTLLSQFNLAQYFGTPDTGDEGNVVAGDWGLDNVDSFGLVY